MRKIFNVSNHNKMIEIHEPEETMKDLKFYFNLPMLELMRTRFSEIPERSGLVISRFNDDALLDEQKIINWITAGQRYSDAFFHERNDISPKCVEFILVK